MLLLFASFMPQAALFKYYMKIILKNIYIYYSYIFKSHVSMFQCLCSIIQIQLLDLLCLPVLFFGPLAEELSSLVQCASRLLTRTSNGQGKPHGIHFLQLTTLFWVIALHWSVKPK